MEDYQPIACVFHERLEFAVLRRLALALNWRDEAGNHEERVLPLDVETRDGAEWLSIRRANGATEVIRLDRILSAREIANTRVEKPITRGALEK